jgi:hypothetical protein
MIRTQISHWSVLEEGGGFQFGISPGQIAPVPQRILAQQLVPGRS